MWYVWVVLWSPGAGDDYDGRDHHLECERCTNAVRASSRQQWLVSRSRWLPAGGHVGQCGVVEGRGRSGHGTSSASAGGLAGSCGQLYLGVCGRRGEGGWIWAAGSIGVRQGRGGCCRWGWCVGTAERGLDQCCSALPWAWFSWQSGPCVRQIRWTGGIWVSLWRAWIPSLLQMSWTLRSRTAVHCQIAVCVVSHALQTAASELRWPWRWWSWRSDVEQRASLSSSQQQWRSHSHQGGRCLWLALATDRLGCHVGGVSLPADCSGWSGILSTSSRYAQCPRWCLSSTRTSWHVACTSPFLGVLRGCFAECSSSW